MRAIILILPLVLAGCIHSSDMSGYIRVAPDNPVATAANFIGYSEYTHRAELRAFTGVDPVRIEWCAAFVNSVLEESNIKSNKDHKYPLTARAFLDWGVRVNEQDIEPGDLVVFPRGNQGWQGHVGFFIREAEINGKKYYYILGGNQSNMVSIEMYPANRALGIRRQSSI